MPKRSPNQGSDAYSYILRRRNQRLVASMLSILLAQALKTSHCNLDNCCYNAQQAYFPVALHAEVLSCLPCDDHAKKDGGGKDQFTHQVFQVKKASGVGSLKDHGEASLTDSRRSMHVH